MIWQQDCEKMKKQGLDPFLDVHKEAVAIQEELGNLGSVPEETDKVILQNTLLDLFEKSKPQLLLKWNSDFWGIIVDSCKYEGKCSALAEKLEQCTKENAEKVHYMYKRLVQYGKKNKPERELNQTLHDALYKLKI